MNDSQQLGQFPVAPDSRAAAAPSSPSGAQFDEVAILRRPFWSVPETAFMTGLSVRTVWRELSDPTSKFPRPRRVRRRTLLVAAEVLAFLREDAAR